MLSVCAGASAAPNPVQRQRQRHQPDLICLRQRLRQPAPQSAPTLAPPQLCLCSFTPRAWSQPRASSADAKFWSTTIAGQPVSKYRFVAFFVFCGVFSSFLQCIGRGLPRGALQVRGPPCAHSQAGVPCGRGRMPKSPGLAFGLASGCATLGSCCILQVAWFIRCNLCNCLVHPVQIFACHSSTATPTSCVVHPPQLLMCAHHCCAAAPAAHCLWCLWQVSSKHQRAEH